MSKKRPTTILRAATPEEVDALKGQYLRDEYADAKPAALQEARQELADLKVGSAYYHGGREAYRDIYLVDNLTVQPGKKKGDSPRYLVWFREWDYDQQAYVPSHYSEGRSLRDFLQYLEFPALTKHPLELFREAEEALTTRDIDRYLPETRELEDAPDTQVMHVGSKAALELVHAELLERRDAAVVLRRTMGLVIEQKKAQLERVRERMKGAIKIFEKKIAKIYRVITTIELYLGVEESIVQIQEGTPAPEGTPLSIRQGLMFMDEEIGDPWDDGQGLEWDKKSVAAFDDWLTRNDNYKKVLPETKGVAAFQARRNPKDREGDAVYRAVMAANDMTTFLLMRNGDQLYRLITDKIRFRPRLFPRRDELQRLFEYWKIADALEQKSPGKRIHMDYEGKDAGRYGGGKEGRDPFADFHHDGSETSDAKEYAEDHVFFYKMRLTLLQGLLDRTAIFHPLPEGLKLFNPAAQEAGQVRLIYDDELCLPTGRLPFWEWLAGLNASITFGSRIVLSHNWAYRYSLRQDYSQHSSEFHANRLDDRFSSSSSYALPPVPPEGLYFVKRGERWEREPLWVPNPTFDPDKYPTKDQDRFSPEQETNQKWRKVEVIMTYAEQKKWFGKIVAKDTFDHHHTHDHSGEELTDDHKHGDVTVDWNPPHLHYCEVRPNRYGGGTYYHFEYRDVAHHFPCIRYNPKDEIARDGWTWRPEAEDRKVALSWKIFPADAFVINYDEVTPEDIEFYVTSRVDRREYAHIMPLLWKVRTTLLEERAGEVEFKKLVAGEVLRATGQLPAEVAVDAAVEAWKCNLKWKRAIAHDDAKALRMIVKALKSKLILR